MALGKRLQELDGRDRSSPFSGCVSAKCRQFELGVLPVEKREVIGVGEGGGVYQQGSGVFSMLVQKRFKQHEPKWVIAQNDGVLWRQEPFDFGKIAAQRFTPEGQDRREVPANQHNGDEGQERPKAGGHTQIENSHKWMRPFAGVGVAVPKDEQQVAAEIAHTQARQIGNWKEGISVVLRTDLTRADSHIEGHPNARQQKDRMDDMKHGGGEENTQGTRVPEIGGPADANDKQGNQGGQAQKQQVVPRNTAQLLEFSKNRLQPLPEVHMRSMREACQQRQQQDQRQPGEPENKGAQQELGVEKAQAADPNHRREKTGEEREHGPVLGNG